MDILARIEKGARRGTLATRGFRAPRPASPPRIRHAVFPRRRADRPRSCCMRSPVPAATTTPRSPMRTAVALELNALRVARTTTTCRASTTPRRERPALGAGRVRRAARGAGRRRDVRSARSQLLGEAARPLAAAARPAARDVAGGTARRSHRRGPGLGVRSRASRSPTTSAPRPARCSPRPPPPAPRPRAPRAASGAGSATGSARLPGRRRHPRRAVRSGRARQADRPDVLLGRPSAARELGLDGAIFHFQSLVAQAIAAIRTVGAAPPESLVWMESERLVPKAWCEDAERRGPWPDRCRPPDAARPLARAARPAADEPRPEFHRRAASFPLTRPFVRRDARALFDLVAGSLFAGAARLRAPARARLRSRGAPRQPTSSRAAPDCPRKAPHACSPAGASLHPDRGRDDGRWGLGRRAPDRRAALGGRDDRAPRDAVPGPVDPSRAAARHERDTSMSGYGRTRTPRRRRARGRSTRRVSPSTRG